MNLRSPLSRRRFPSRNALILFLVLLGFQAAAPVQARAAPPLLRPAVKAVAPVVAEGWSWRKLYAPVEGGLASKRRMLQFGVIGMCVALYIIWWRR